MPDQVIGMQVFLRVATMGSMAAAARAIGMSQTMVTKHLNAIEARLGVKLVHKTTRRLALTEAGRSYLEACTRILAEIAEAESTASAGQLEPRGRLRMSVPVAFGTLQLAPLLKEFADVYQGVVIEFGLNDRVVDLVEEGWDLAIRIGELQDSTLVTRRLSPCRMQICASPAYLAANGNPTTIHDLTGHNCLGYTLSTRFGSDRWTFAKGKEVTIQIAGSFQANNGDALRTAALAGLGIIYQPTFLVSADLRAGRLVALQLDHDTVDVGHVHAVFPPNRRLALKTRVMIDFLASRFGDTPPWDRADDPRVGALRPDSLNGAQFK